MTKITFATHPQLLGFDQLDSLVKRTIKNSNEGYPPYNIEVLDQHQYRISIALAGFSREDIDITLEANQLCVKGAQSKPDGSREFLHQGIATRQFQRSFVLAEGVEVVAADLSDGLLHIDLTRTPPTNITKTILINTK